MPLPYALFLRFPRLEIYQLHPTRWQPIEILPRRPTCFPILDRIYSPSTEQYIRFAKPRLREENVSLYSMAFVFLKGRVRREIRSGILCGLSYTLSGRQVTYRFISVHGESSGQRVIHARRTRKGIG